ncbi:hypothetical protein FVEN_g5499 [Fusarium venenatum]|nr:hypothetical protein FVEN_g5499 [Fusarium venenatum]
MQTSGIRGVSCILNITPQWRTGTLSPSTFHTITYTLLTNFTINQVAMSSDPTADAIVSQEDAMTFEGTQCVLAREKGKTILKDSDLS